MLCAVDEAHDHSISVWDWQKGDKGYKITETKVSNFNRIPILKKNICFVQFIILTGTYLGFGERGTRHVTSSQNGLEENISGAND